MNKGDLVDRIHEDTGLSKADAERALNSFIDTVQVTVTAGEKVTLPGFGVFSRSARSARSARNPRTGELMQIPATNAAKFTVGAKFKAQVSGK